MCSAPGVIKKIFLLIIFLSNDYLYAHEGDVFFNSMHIRLPAIFGILIAVLFIILITSKRTLIKLRKRNSLLLSNANEKILICDSEGNVRECISDENCMANLKDMFGQENLWEIMQALKSVSVMDMEKVIQLILSKREEDKEDSYYRIVLQNMKQNNEIKGISVTIEDITDFKCMENRLIRSKEMAFHEARHDPLTSIPNRLYFNEAIKKRFARLERHKEETLCLLMLDLDHFKDVNDNFGHDVGDEVLIKLTEICSEMIRASDVFARFGGEEFVCYLDDLSESAALDAAERMRQRIEVSNNWPLDINLTVSIGLAEYDGEEQPADLIKKADIALYNAKALGRNRVCVYLATEG